MALPMKAMKAMKSMKATKAMKGMKAVRGRRGTSKIARGKRARSSVFRGTKEKTIGGLTRDKLMKNKRGKVVSKAASAAARKRGSHFECWGRAVSAARKAMGITGFCVVGGESVEGRALYLKAKSLYSA
eukprot:CAMPEP_0204531014 /NCGR_PEP_ID=MMETSP0661-20131031/10938_1 /ASSEMBLY_ACC=CAM_ASM_000606 /TAXON_ID=109239 /ORGANISM="Alexandrium margalefi, Strain AMGDE01CS-322" /LENGTH=128 /DNA_ID=CAMNT_0051537141 /DNA_START=56 /DNA_END=442 /DNA_ORIENTATION=-